MTRKTAGLITLMALSCMSAAKAAPRHTVQRGKLITVETQFKSGTNVQAAYLTWQTYGSTSPKQSSMATAFGCAADVVTDGSAVFLACKVPLDVADGHYSLTSIIVETSDSKREYSFTKDLPAEVEIDIKNGPEVSVPDIQSIQVKY